MSKMLSLSVVIIAKNEAEMLPDALTSVMWADEIIVLDCNSTDTTNEIAFKYGAQVHKIETWEGFGKQRQIAQELTTGDMILMLDADERVTSKLRLSIEKVLHERSSLNKVYSFGRCNLFLGRFMHYSGWYPDIVKRLYPRKIRYNDNLIHESLNTHGAPVVRLKGNLKHLTCRNLLIFQHKQLNYAEAWAQQNFQYGKNCSIISIFIHTLGAFIKTLLVRAGFLDGKQGLILAVINAQYTFNKYLALWELHNISKKRF